MFVLGSQRLGGTIRDDGGLGERMLDKLGSQAQAQRPVAGMSLWVPWVGLFIAVGITYFVAGRVGLALLTTPERVAVFWPASGIPVGILIALGARARAPVAAGVIAATLAANLMADRSIWSAMAFGLCNAGEALLVMWLIERWFGPAFTLDSLRRVLGFFAAAAAATATAAVGASAAMKLLGPSTAAFLDVWEVWFASDALGVMTVAPLLIGVAASVRDAPSWRELLEGSLAVVALSVVSGFLLAILAGPWSLVGPSVLLFPFLLWLGYRSRPVFAAAAVFTIAAAIVWTTTYELGRYGDPTQPIAIRVMAAQITMLGITLAGLSLAALFAERRRSEAALGESDIRLRSILDAANVIAWDVDLTRNTVHSAGPVARLLHRPEGSMPGDLAAMVDAIHPEDRDSVMAQFWTAVGTAATYRLEFRLNSDSLRWVTAEGAIERDAKGQPVRVRGVTHDITERKKTELALAEREAQLGLAGQATRVGSFAIDIRTGRVRNSPGYATIHGLAEGTDEFPREEWRARVHPDDLPRLDALRSKAFSERRREHNTEYRLVGADGRLQWIESRGLISYDGAGHPTRLVGVNIDVTERKRSQVALEESEARYRALYDDNPSMYFTVDASGTVKSVNEFGARQLGYTPAELVGQSVLEMIHEGDREKARRWLASCAESAGAISRAEMRKIRRDGSILWVRKLARAVDGFGGQTLLIVCEDITERKQAELALAERDAQLGLAGQAARVGSFVIDFATGRIQTSPGFAAIHGLAEESEGLTCEKWRACVLPDDLARFEALRSQALAEQRRELNIEYRIVGADGEARWIESRGLISYDGDGCPARMVGVHIDITERKRTEQSLVERNLQLAMAGKAALVGSFAFDVGSDKIQTSEGYAAIHGFPDGTTEIERSEWRASVHPEDLGGVEELRSRAFRDRRKEYSAEYRIVRPGGEVRWIESRYFVSYHSNGRPRRVIGVNIDVTDRKRAEEHQGALLAELDHRVKNMLATVGAIIVQTPKADSSLPEFVARLDDRIKSLARTHELLSRSRWHGVSLEEIVRRELAPYIADNAEIGGPRVTLKSEAAQAVGMVLHELATNAAKHGAFSIPGGRVLLRWRWLRSGSHGQLAIEWHESGGPPVREPSQPGYGTSIVRELIPFELGGTADMDFDFNGLHCRLGIPANWVRRPASQAMIHQNVVSAQTSPLRLMAEHKAS